MAQKEAAAAGISGLSLHIMEVFLNRYEPANSLADSDAEYTTDEVYERLQEFYPDGLYNKKHVAEMLQETGFKFAEKGHLRFVWLFRKIPPTVGAGSQISS